MAIFWEGLVLLKGFLNMAHSNVDHILPPFIWLFVILDSFITSNIDWGFDENDQSSPQKK
jgi:hypothetical protein